MDRRLFLRWLRATWIGWLLGVPLIVVLALAGEAVGIGGSQTLVGAGMGTGIGLMQSRVIKGLVHKAWPWFWSSVVGLLLPFLVLDIGNALGWKIAFSLPLYVALGGLISGGWQAILLKPHCRTAWLWVVANSLGWALAAGSAFLADQLVRAQSLRGLLGAGLYLGVVAAGGLVLGSVTGGFMARMFHLPPEPLAEPHTTGG